ncbi:MAG: hypothetical protein RIQ81_2047 [Pseudomonadota bacterium]|jgi:hypothetical protein
MENSPGSGGDQNAPVDTPPPLGLIQFTDAFYVPQEFEVAANDGLICVDDAEEVPVSPSIHKIIAGRSWERQGKGAPWQETSRGNSIRPCSHGARGNAVRRQSPLDELVTLFERMHGMIAGLEPVSIELFPAFVNVDGNNKTYATGDMFYDAGRRTIVILPPSSQQASARLWKSPFVVAHELVHHAIDTQVRKASSAKFIPDWCEEGFADAIAFQMTDRKTALVRELPGFGTDRDPSWPSFKDGTRKEELDLSKAAPLHRKGAALAHRLDLQDDFTKLFDRRFNASFKIVIDQCPAI